MEHSSKVADVGKVFSALSLLAHAISTGKPTIVEDYILMVWKATKIIAPQDIERKCWHNSHHIQQVFIDPVEVHLLTKITGNISALCTGYLFDQTTEHYTACIKVYLEQLCECYGINHKAIIIY